MPYPSISIVIPAYNEALRIEQTLDRVLSCVATQGWDAEVLVVDDGSQDATTDIVRRYMATHPELHLIHNPGNRGKGYSVRNGLLQAMGEFVMFTDADLSAPMEEADRLFDALQAGADVAIGSRWLDRSRQTQHQPIYRRFFWPLLQWRDPLGHESSLRRHAVRLQSLSAACRADDLPPAARGALGF